jgi:large subunit ribosomal protein L30
MAVTDKKENSQKKNPNLPEKQLRIELIRSVIGRPKKQREVVKGLGLRRINSVVIRKDCPEVRGMVYKIPHLLKVEELKIK